MKEVFENLGFSLIASYEVPDIEEFSSPYDVEEWDFEGYNIRVNYGLRTTYEVFFGYNFINHNRGTWRDIDSELERVVLTVVHRSYSFTKNDSVICLTRSVDKEYNWKWEMISEPDGNNYPVSEELIRLAQGYFSGDTPENILRDWFIDHGMITD